MKKLIHVLLCTQIAVTALFAQNTVRSDWENPEVFAITEEATSATALPNPSVQLAAKDSCDASPSRGGWIEFVGCSSIGSISFQGYGLPIQLHH